MIMSETQPEGYEVDYSVITFNFNPKKVIRNTALVTATVILTKGAMDVTGHLLKPRIVSLTRKFKTRAIDEAHKKAEAETHGEEKNE